MKAFTKTNVLQGVTLLLLPVMIAFVEGCKKRCDKEVTVIKDCTGTYLRFNEKDYHVCNNDFLQAYEHNTEITATFSRINNCAGDAADDIVCFMLHENEGWVHINAIE